MVPILQGSDFLSFFSTRVAFRTGFEIDFWRLTADHHLGRHSSRIFPTQRRRRCRHQHFLGRSWLGMWVNVGAGFRKARAFLLCMLSCFLRSASCCQRTISGMLDGGGGDGGCGGAGSRGRSHFRHQGRLSRGALGGGRGRFEWDLFELHARLFGRLPAKLRMMMVMLLLRFRMRASSIQRTRISDFVPTRRL